MTKNQPAAIKQIAKQIKIITYKILAIGAFLFGPLLVSDAETPANKAPLKNPLKIGWAHALRLGDIGFVTNPFELYLDYGMRIKGRSPAMQTFIVQLAGPGSYVPTERSIEGGAYGAVPASTEIGVEGGDQLVEWSVDTLHSLWGSEKKASK